MITLLLRGIPPFIAGREPPCIHKVRVYSTNEKLPLGNHKRHFTLRGCKPCFIVDGFVVHGFVVVVSLGSRI